MDDVRVERLRKAVNDSGLSQTEICERAGIGKSSLSSYLSGLYYPRQKALDGLSRVLNVSIPYLMGFEVSGDTDYIIKDESGMEIITKLTSTTKDMSEEQLERLLQYAKLIKEGRL